MAKLKIIHIMEDVEDNSNNVGKCLIALEGGDYKVVSFIRENGVIYMVKEQQYTFNKLTKFHAYTEGNITKKEQTLINEFYEKGINEIEITRAGGKVVYHVSTQPVQTEKEGIIYNIIAVSVNGAMVGLEKVATLEE